MARFLPPQPQPTESSSSTQPEPLIQQPPATAPAHDPILHISYTLTRHTVQTMTSILQDAERFAALLRTKTFATANGSREFAAINQPSSWFIGRLKAYRMYSCLPNDTGHCLDVVRVVHRYVVFQFFLVE
ncbi:predicted protein [Lichtheimia corymbifera JMRC:FSU:9682]|uniref:Uncharacterized protein n=1 Tax=Lichtheimia corymbifera JMRC:FSU:9682 TaxID=1263082 RepID=A0A068S1U4_9FUNG|nr:predicted protein [Lichtheimia corymbifera JMRC:FSU:9682]